MNEVTFEVTDERLANMPPVLNALNAEIAMDWATRMTGVQCVGITRWRSEMRMSTFYKFEFAAPIDTRNLGLLGLE